MTFKEPFILFSSTLMLNEVRAIVMKIRVGRAKRIEREATFNEWNIVK